MGGQWRGRRLPITTAGKPSALRPTPDRVRETLFNWLAPLIQGARCLDAYAGTGALGLEALSRGAGEVVFIERDRQLAQQIRQQLTVLAADAEVVCCEFAHAPFDHRPFDVVFLDPPFNRDLVAPAAAALATRLAAGNRVYMEYAAAEVPQLGPGWTVLKQKQAGQVGYCLATFSAAGKDSLT